MLLKEQKYMFTLFKLQYGFIFNEKYFKDCKHSQPVKVMMLKNYICLINLQIAL